MDNNNKVKSYLTKWGLDSYLDIFENSGIDEEAFLLLEAENINNLITKEGHCVKFQNKLSLLKNELKQKQQENQLPLAIENELSTSTSEFSHISCSSPQNESYIEQVKKGNVFAKAIPKKDLRQKDRLRLAEAIINYEFTGDVKHIITPARFIQIRIKIEKEFPDESGDVWYIPYSKESKRDPLGCLYDKYCSLNRLLVKNGLRVSQRGSKPVETPNQLEGKC